MVEIYVCFIWLKSTLHLLKRQVVFFTKLYCNTKKIVMRCNQDGYALCLEEFNLASPTKKSKTKKFL